jgi:hypothetical protein
MKTVTATEEVGHMEPTEDSDHDGIRDHVDVNPNDEPISSATQVVLDGIFDSDTDSDRDKESDGILEFLDETGKESQMERWYDAEFKM